MVSTVADGAGLAGAQHVVLQDHDELKTGQRLVLVIDHTTTFALWGVPSTDEEAGLEAFEIVSELIAKAPHDPDLYRFQFTGNVEYELLDEGPSGTDPLSTFGARYYIEAVVLPEPADKPSKTLEASAIAPIVWIIVGLVGLALTTVLVVEVRLLFGPFGQALKSAAEGLSAAPLGIGWLGVLALLWLLLKQKKD